MNTRTKATLAGVTIAATTAALTPALMATAATTPAPHCARTQELCDVVEYVLIQPNGTHKIETCYLTNAAYKPSPVSIRIAVYHCVTP